MKIEQIRDVVLALPVIGAWPELREYWLQATGRPRPDWMLPLRMWQAVSGLPAPTAVGNTMSAAIGCTQLSIILTDDVLDNDERTLARLTPGMAANMAQAFQAIGIELLQKISPHVTCHLVKMVQETAVGQHLDTQTNPGEDEYWRIVKAKSCPFYRNSLLLGLTYSGGNGQLPALTSRFGDLLGEMVQINDDLEDIIGETPSPDWVRGNNLLLVYGRVVPHPHQKKLKELVSLVANSASGSTHSETAQNILLEIGAVDYAVSCLREKCAEAERVLGEMKLADKKPLEELLERQKELLYQLID